MVPALRLLLGVFLLSAGLLVVTASGARAAAGDSFIEYHTSNMQLLKGWDYELGDEGRTLMTLEHYNRWRYGDLFMFTDITRFDHGGSTIYGEISPRLSLNKIADRDLSWGPVKDWYLSGTWEEGKESVRAYLYGGAVDLDLPGFTVAVVNVYVRDDPNISGKTWQTTLVWKYPFKAAGLQFIYEGFADIAGGEGATYHDNQFIVPRLLLDVGNLSGGKDGRLFAGVEWQYWRNKYGVRGVTESVPQLQLKWVFDK